MDAAAKALPLIKELLTIIGLCIVLPLSLGAILYFVLRYQFKEIKAIRENVLLLSELAKTQGETQAAAIKALTDEAKELTQTYLRIAIALEGLPERLRTDPNRKSRVGG